MVGGRDGGCSEEWANSLAMPVKGMGPEGKGRNLFQKGLLSISSVWSVYFA